jgi:hypothetical protein
VKVAGRGRITKRAGDYPGTQGQEAKDMKQAKLGGGWTRTWQLWGYTLELEAFARSRTSRLWCLTVRRVPRLPKLDA